MSQNGSWSINSVRWAWVSVTSAKERLSRRSGWTPYSPPKPQQNLILSEDLMFSRYCHKARVYMNQSLPNKTISTHSG